MRHNYRKFIRAKSQIISLVLVCSCILFIHLVVPKTANAYTEGTISFKWLSNPPEDNIIGYRLYYGKSSRFNANGSTKSNFSYDYYIDFKDSLRCKTDGSTCEYLDPNELNCQNLQASSPSCTLAQLTGTLYFSLTACSDRLESGYTHELKAVPGSNLNCIMAVQSLLLKKK